MRHFRTAAIVLIVISASHLAGHLLLIPHFQLIHNFTGKLPANATEEQLLSLMNHYHKRIGGTPMSMMDIQNGLSLCYSLFFLWLGVLNLILFKSVRRDRHLMVNLSYLNSFMSFLGAIIAAVYFFWLPIVSFLSAAILFLIPARTIRKYRT